MKPNLYIYTIGLGLFAPSRLTTKVVGFVRARVNSHIEVCPVARKNNKLIVDFGWFDPFLYVNDKLNAPTTFTPQIVTPAFVRKAVEFALKHNWNLAEKAAVTKVVYRDNIFNKISST